MAFSFRGGKMVPEGDKLNLPPADSRVIKKEDLEFPLEIPVYPGTKKETTYTKE